MMTKLKEPVLTFESVLAWIKDKPAKESVGWTSFTDLCPLSLLGQQQGFEDISVKGMYVSWNRGRRMRTGDPFVLAFVKAVDKLGQLGLCAEVTAGQVRAILAELAPEFGPQS